jgi:RNA polymerase sigma-70 factor, ECF subfamily
MLEHTRLTDSVADAGPGHQAKRLVDMPSSPLGSSPSAPNFGELPDLLLVERTRGRDIRAFETLMRRYNRRLHRIARSILNNNELAEEAVRVAYLRAYANLDRYEPAGKVGAWLARLAFNEALAQRRHSTASTPAPVVQGVVTEVADGGERVVTSAQLEAAIDSLPEVFRTVLVLRVLEDMSGVDVAVCLGLNETTVRTRLYRAQQRLKTEMARLVRAQAANIFVLTSEHCDRIVTQVFARLHTLPLASESR